MHTRCKCLARLHRNALLKTLVVLAERLYVDDVWYVSTAVQFSDGSEHGTEACVTAIEGLAQAAIVAQRPGTRVLPGIPRHLPDRMVPYMHGSLDS